MNRNYERYWLEKGTILSNKYEIIDVINEGGLGIVYLGMDRVLKIDVAIKEYFPRRFAMREAGDKLIQPYKGISEKNFKKGLEKFLYEARILAKFNDIENIVTVRDFFYENNTAYIINEHVVGETLKEYVHGKGPISGDKALEIMKPIMYSLGEIHETGLIHRDISPDNIILQENKGILIDFGAARTFSEQDDRSMTVFFKRGYSAQEQYIKNGKQTAKTDIYALCATMYYMLTGVQPEESVQRTIKDNVIPLYKMKEIKLDTQAKRAIMKGMSVSVSDRYSSVFKLCEVLYTEERKNNWKIFAYRIAILFVIFGLCFFSFVKSLDKTPPRAETDYVLEETNLIDSGSIIDFRNSNSSSNSAIKTSEPVRSYIIPNVINRNEEKAVQIIKKKTSSKIKVVVKKQYHDKIKKGNVIRQKPKTGTDIGKVKKVVIWVSKGKKKRPDGIAYSTPQPSVTQGAELDNAVKKKNTDDFAGVLPW